jgi:hypothetical protein
VTAAIYLLCALTAALCAALLLRGYARTHTRLLLWSGLCFCGLALNNAMLVLDRATPLVDLSTARTLPALLGLSLLIYGLVWETR